MQFIKTVSRNLSAIIFCNFPVDKYISRPSQLAKSSYDLKCVQVNYFFLKVIATYCVSNKHFAGVMFPPEFFQQLSKCSRE